MRACERVAVNEKNTHLDVTTRVWPIISDSEIADVLGRLEHPLAGTPLTVSNRPTTAGILVDVGPRTVFIKRHGPRTVPADHLRAVHGLVAHVRDRGIPTPALLRFADHDTLWETPAGTWEVYEGAQGEDRYRDAPTWTVPRTLDEARALGAMTARLAIASADYRARRNPACAYQSSMHLFASDPRRDLPRWLAERPGVRAYLAHSGRRIEDQWAPHLQFAASYADIAPRLPVAWTHGDLHVSNVFWDGNHPSQVIDFGLADRNPAVYDLALAIERNAFEWTRIVDGDEDAVRADVTLALIEGYEEIRPLSPDERCGLVAMMPLVQAEAGLNWIEYQYGATRSLHGADWCLDIFFGEHTRWFTRPSGRDYLAWLDDALTHD